MHFPLFKIDRYIDICITKRIVEAWRGRRGTLVLLSLLDTDGVNEGQDIFG